MHLSSSAGFFFDPSGAFTSPKRMRRSPGSLRLKPMRRPPWTASPGIAKFHSMMMPVQGIKTILRIPQVMNMVKTTAIAPRKEP